MNEKKIIIGNTIKEGLKKKGMKQAEFAALMNVCRPTVSGWVSGKYTPPGDVLLEVIEKLEIWEELFPFMKGKQQTEVLENKLEHKITNIENRLSIIEKALHDLIKS